jgi:transcriptional regulator with XRE-family HTH domain
MVLLSNFRCHMSKRAQETIGDRVRQAREMAGLSQGKLATLMGLPSGHTRSIENRSNLHTDTAANVARTLGISIEWLVLGTGVKPTEKAIEAAVKAAEAKVQAIRDGV